MHLRGETELCLCREAYPGAYISRRLFPREVRYSTVEKEALAVKWALDSFKYYLLERESLLWGLTTRHYNGWRG